MLKQPVLDEVENSELSFTQLHIKKGKIDL